MSANRKRILFIASQPYMEWRGSPIRVSFNMRALSELGYDVDLLTLPFGKDHETPHVRVIRVGNVPGCTGVPIGPSIWKLFFDAKLWWRARKLIKEQPYDVIHAVEDAGFIAVSLARLSGAQLIFEKHSDPGSYRKKGLRNIVMWAYGKVEAYTIRKADAVIGTGPGLVAQAQRIAPDKPCHHIFDIPSSLAVSDPEKTALLRGELSRYAGEVLITYVGSFAVYQGIDLLFNAIPEVVRHAAQARFIIIGGTETEINEYRALLVAQKVDHAVTFLGKLSPDELPDYLAAADILLSTRLAGTNTPLKLLDYLKAGRCIIATDNEANRQILDDQSALLVQPDASALAAGVCALVADPARREALAAQGHERIRQTYNYDEFKCRLGRIYAGQRDRNSIE